MAGISWYVTNNCVQRDLDIQTVKEVIRKLVESYKRRVHRHPNTLAFQLLEEPPIVRLRRRLPRQIACRSQPINTRVNSSPMTVVCIPESSINDKKIM